MLELFGRNINPPHGGVFAHITNNVSELESDSQILGKAFRRLIPVPKDAYANQAHDGSDAIAVNPEILERAVVNHRIARGGCVRGNLQVHGGAVGKLIEQFHRNRKIPPGIGKREQNGIIGRLAGKGSVSCFQPFGQPLAPQVRHYQGVIADVIATPHVGIHRT